MIGYFFLHPVDPVRTRIPEKISPAITVRGERGIADADGVTGCERTGEGEVVSMTVSNGVEIGEVTVDVEKILTGSVMVIVLLSVFFIDGLPALTKYWPGGKSPRNS